MRILQSHSFEKKANVVGISFHVGSNCFYANSYKKAIEDASKLFQYSKEKWGIEMSLLDLGGGWPGIKDEAFTNIAQAVEKTLALNIDSKVKIIAEPGRYFATQTTTAVMKILGKSIRHTNQKKEISYYLSNGIYDLFISSLYYNYDPKKLADEGWKFLPLKTDHNQSTYKSFLWGPTCDSTDKLIEWTTLPEMNTGDFIYSKNVGAYTYPFQTSFNQIPPSKPYYACKVKKTC